VSAANTARTSSAMRRLPGAVVGVEREQERAGLAADGVHQLGAPQQLAAPPRARVAPQDERDVVIEAELLAARQRDQEGQVIGEGLGVLKRARREQRRARLGAGHGEQVLHAPVGAGELSEVLYLIEHRAVRVVGHAPVTRPRVTGAGVVGARRWAGRAGDEHAPEGRAQPRHPGSPAHTAKPSTSAGRGLLTSMQASGMVRSGWQPSSKSLPSSRFRQSGGWQA